MKSRWLGTFSPPNQVLQIPGNPWSAISFSLLPAAISRRKAGAPVDAEARGIAADSLAPRRIGEQVFPIASRYVSSVYLVSDDEIRTAQRTLWDSLRIVAEPGGAAAFAGLLSGKYKPAAGEQVGVVISGANTVAVNFDLQEKRTNA